MKRTFFFLILHMFFLTSYSQVYIQEYDTGKDLDTLKEIKISTGVSAGINNMPGFVGLNFEYIFYKGTAVDVAVGISTWGYKFGIGLSKHSIWADKFYARISYLLASGGIGQDIQLKDINDSTRSYSIYFHPAQSLQVVVGKDWRVGKKKNRIFFEVGYTLLFARSFDDLVTVLDNNPPLSDVSKLSLVILAPGGLSIGLGFLFGM